MVRSPVPVRSAPTLATAAVVWSARGHLRLTVIAKATFAIVPGATLRLVAPMPIETADVHNDGNPGRSVRAVSELVPHLPAVDVTLVGEAQSPQGAPATHVVARLALFRERTPLLDKQIHVFGQESGDTVAPFKRMPLTYERAYGGIGFQDNPLGRGVSASDPKPNLRDPRDPRKVACFAPISPAWPARKRLLHAEVRRGLERPVPEIPADFDWSYFQAAPPDQRVERLRGGEHLLLSGMHASLPEVYTRLPLFEAMARFSGHTADPGEVHPIALEASSLWIDAEAGRVTVTFRGSVPVAREELLSRAQVAVALALDGAPLEWPAAATPSAEPAASPAEGRFEATVMLDEAAPRPPQRSRRDVTVVQAARAAREQTLPFAPSTRGSDSAPPSPHLPIPGAPWGAAAPAPPPLSALSPTRATLPLDQPLFLSLPDEPPARPAPLPPPRVDRPLEELPPQLEAPPEPPRAQEPPAAAPTPPAAPERDPYGQAAPWAAGPPAAPAPPAPPAPKLPAKPTTGIYKKFGKR